MKLRVLCSVYVCVEVEGLPVEAVIGTGAQCTIIVRELLRNLGRHMKANKMELPRCTPPNVKLVGWGGESAVSLLFGWWYYLCPVFVQPDSDIQCLLGMNMIPFLGIRVERANGEVIVEPTALESSPEARVYLIHSTRIQGRKGTVVEAKFDLLIARATEEFLSNIGTVSVDALLSRTNEGKVPVPLEIHIQ